MIINPSKVQFKDKELEEEIHKKKSSELDKMNVLD